MSAATRPRNIADKSFWENEYYWSDVSLPCRVDMDLAFDRSLARALADYAPAEPGQSVLEIGCAPAKWLIYYAERFGAKVAGIEYSDKGAQIARENLAAAGVVGTIHGADFLDIDPVPHDLVLSLGFIEHFDDLEAAFARHLKFVAPGGRLALGVPNFRGMNRVVQWLAEPHYLAIHNVAAMLPEWYRNLERRYGLELESLHYIGGFDPVIVKLGDKSSFSLRRAAVGAVTLLESRFRTLGLAERVEHRWLSCYLLGVFRIPA